MMIRGRILLVRVGAAVKRILSAPLPNGPLNSAELPTPWLKLPNVSRLAFEPLLTRLNMFWPAFRVRTPIVSDEFVVVLALYWNVAPPVRVTLRLPRRSTFGPPVLSSNTRDPLWKTVAAIVFPPVSEPAPESVVT